MDLSGNQTEQSKVISKATTTLAMEGTIMHLEKVGPVDASIPVVKKCTRCRVKRTEETPEQLAKYSTCHNCRKNRKVVKPVEEVILPGVIVDYGVFIERVKFNTTEDVHELRFRGRTSEAEFPRPEADEDVVKEVYQHYAKRLTDLYISPISHTTGYTFAVRDYHKGGRKTKKITFMFICAQDKGRQRKSRSNRERNVNNKLKTEYCGSRVSLSYTLNDGTVSLVYSHKCHPPYGSLRHVRTPLSSRGPISHGISSAELSLDDLSTQLPPLQNIPVRPMDYNLSSIAQYNTQVQFSQMVGVGRAHPKEDQMFSAEPYAEKTAEAIVAMAASAQQQQANYKDGSKISVENIDKELIAMNE